MTKLFKCEWFAGTIVWLTMMASSMAMFIAACGGNFGVVLFMNAALILSGSYLTGYSLVVRVREKAG